MIIGLHAYKLSLSESGYTSLMMVLVVTAVATTMILSAVDAGIVTGRSVTSNEIGAQARLNAHSCIEEALERIRQNSNYNASFSLSLNIGSCNAQVTGSRASKTINANGLVGDFAAEIQATTSAINPVINVDSWN